jgi:UDPglucose 6-dehydrogenase
MALVRTANDAGAPVRLIETTVAVNDARKKAMATPRRRRRWTAT